MAGLIRACDNTDQNISGGRAQTHLFNARAEQNLKGTSCWTSVLQHIAAGADF
jgi:hypothetical protein